MQVGEGVDGKLAGEGAGFAHQHAAQGVDGDIVIVRQLLERREAVGDDGEAVEALQMLDHAEGGGGGVDVDDVVILHKLGGGTADFELGGGHIALTELDGQAECFAVVEGRLAVGVAQQAAGLQDLVVPSDGGGADIELFGQIVDRHIVACPHKR